MSEEALSERGYFWWAGQEYDDAKFAPESSTYGTLVIDAEGQIRLELDGYLDAPASYSRDDTREQLTIAGTLKSDGRSVLMYNSVRTGRTISSGRISHEKFRPMYCLASSGSVRSMLSWDNRVDKISIEFGALEDWLDVRPVEIRSDGNTIDVHYEPPEPLIAELHDRTVRIEHHLIGPWWRTHPDTKAHLTQRSALEFLFREPISVERAAAEHRRTYELMVVLTDKEIDLPWPMLTGGRGVPAATLYYAKNFKGADEFDHHESWTSLGSLKDVFPIVLANWNEKSERYGAGFYLYHSTRRGNFHYNEQHFMALIWGLGALSRASGSAGVDPGLAEKIDRILGSVQPRDRRWLRARLGNAAEISLENRLVRMIVSIGLPLDEREIRAFALNCARIRNSVSHYGVADRTRSTSDAYHYLHHHIRALDILYHIIILFEIGIPVTVILSILTERWHSHTIRFYLSRVGINFPGRGAATAEPSERGV